MNDSHIEIRQRYIGVGTGLGIAIGAGLGVAVGGPRGLALGTSCGVAIGMAFGAALAELYIRAAKRPPQGEDDNL